MWKIHNGVHAVQFDLTFSPIITSPCMVPISSFPSTRYAFSAYAFSASSIWVLLLVAPSLLAFLYLLTTGLLVLSSVSTVKSALEARQSLCLCNPKHAEFVPQSRQQQNYLPSSPISLEYRSFSRSQSLRSARGYRCPLEPCTTNAARVAAANHWRRPHSFYLRPVRNASWKENKIHSLPPGSPRQIATSRRARSRSATIF